MAVGLLTLAVGECTLGAALLWQCWKASVSL